MANRGRLCAPMLLVRVFRSHEVANVLSRGLAATTRGLWGLLVPILLSVDQFGKYSILKTEAGLLGQLSLLGAPQVVLRRNMQIRSPSGLVIHSLGLLTLGWFMWGALLQRGHSAVVYILAASQVAQAIGAAWIRRNGLFRRALVAEVAFAALLASGAAAFVLWGASARTEAVWWLLRIEATIGMVVGLWLLSTRSGGGAFSGGERPAYSGILRETYEIGALVLTDAVLWRRVELFFVEASHGATAAGVLALGLQLGDIACLPMAAIVEAWYPVFSEAWGKGMAEWKQEWVRRLRVFRIVLILSIPMSLVGVATLIHMPPLRRYWSWLLTILILVLTRVVFNYAGVYASALYATGHQRVLYFPTLTASAMTLVSNWILTPRFGLAGAVTARLISHGYLALATILAAKGVLRP